MKATFFTLSTLTAFATAAAPAAMKGMQPSELLPGGLTPEDLASPDFQGIADKKGVTLERRQDGCKRCVDNCNSIGGLGDAACKVVICAIEVCLSSRIQGLAI